MNKVGQRMTITPERMQKIGQNWKAANQRMRKNLSMEQMGKVGRVSCVHE